MTVNLRDATGEADMSAVRCLFVEYAQSLSVSLAFQQFDDELARLPGEYAPPTGALLLAEWEGKAGACVGLHSWGEGIAEMKRLYVRPALRGTGVGRRLVEAAMTRARELGYERIRLDTLPEMASAQALYRRLGFEEIEAYRPSPIPGTLYLEAVLHPGRVAPLS